VRALPNLRLVVVQHPGNTESVDTVSDDRTPTAVGRREHLRAVIHKVGVETAQLFLRVAVQHHAVLLSWLIAAKVAAHEVNISRLKVQVHDVPFVGLHFGVSTEHALVKLDRLRTPIDKIDVRNNVRHGLFPLVLPAIILLRCDSGAIVIATVTS
jgi:hypothetical protein